MYRILEIYSINWYSILHKEIDFDFSFSHDQRDEIRSIVESSTKNDIRQIDIRSCINWLKFHFSLENLENH